MIQFLCALLWVLILFGLPITGWYASRPGHWADAQRLVDGQWEREGASEDRELQRWAELNDYWQQDELPEDDEVTV